MFMLGKVYVRSSLCFYNRKALFPSGKAALSCGSPAGYPARKVYVCVVFSPQNGPSATVAKDAFNHLASYLLLSHLAVGQSCKHL